MITRLRLTDFKNFRSVDVPLGPFSVIVGANASGVVATTHSPDLLGLLSPESLKAALLVYRLPGATDARVKRIMELPDETLHRRRGPAADRSLGAGGTRPSGGMEVGGDPRRGQPEGAVLRAAGRKSGGGRRTRRRPQAVGRAGRVALGAHPATLPRGHRPSRRADPRTARCRPLSRLPPTGSPPRSCGRRSVRPGRPSRRAGRGRPAPRVARRRRARRVRRRRTRLRGRSAG